MTHVSVFDKIKRILQFYEKEMLNYNRATDKKQNRDNSGLLISQISMKTGCKVIQPGTHRSSFTG